MTVKHVTNADGKGWLVVRWPDGTTVPALPQYLRVEYLRSDAGREYFKVLEGLRAGREASVKVKGVGQSYLANGDPQQPAATVKFKLSTNELWYGASGPVSTVTMAANPVPIGVHDLEIPDEVHSMGERYQGDSSYATTWFRIGHGGDRFLHPGRISAGCATVTDVRAWTDIYTYLIRRRKGDGKSVGTLTVVN